MKPFTRTQRIVLAVVAVVAVAVSVYFGGIYLAALAYVAASTTSFVVVYHRLQRWWDTAVGRNIMLMMFSLAAITDLALVNNLLGRPVWMRWVFWALYLAIGSAAWWRLYLLLKTYHSEQSLRAVRD